MAIQRIAHEVVEALTGQPVPEKVIAAACRLPNGKVYTGSSHGDVREKMPRTTDDYEDGFVTNKGRFVNREEAYELAIGAKQMTAKGYAQASADLWGGPPTDDHAGIDALTFNLARERMKKPH